MITEVTTTETANHYALYFTSTKQHKKGKLYTCLFLPPPSLHFHSFVFCGVGRGGDVDLWQKTDEQLYNEASLAQSINSGTAADSPLLSVLVFVTDSTPYCEFSADHPSSSCLSRPVYDSAPCNYYKRMEPRVLFFAGHSFPPGPLCLDGLPFQFTIFALNLRECGHAQRDKHV